MARLRFVLLAALFAATLLFSPCPAFARQSSQQPARVVSLAPNVTEVVAAVGGLETLVGVSDYCTYPPEVTSLPRVGALLNPNFEQIRLLAPDLVLLQTPTPEALRACSTLGVTCLGVQMDSVATIQSGIGTISEALGRTREGAALLGALLGQLEEIGSRMTGGSVRVFLDVGHAPGSLTGLTTVGSTSFLHELLAIAGGENIFADLDAPYAAVSKETLLTREPELVLVLAPGADEEAEAQLRADYARLALPARVEVLTEDYLLIPGPRITRTAARMQQAIRGE